MTLTEVLIIVLFCLITALAVVFIGFLIYIRKYARDAYKKEFLEEIFSGEDRYLIFPPRGLEFDEMFFDKENQICMFTFKKKVEEDCVYGD